MEKILTLSFRRNINSHRTIRDCTNQWLICKTNIICKQDAYFTANCAKFLAKTNNCVFFTQTPHLNFQADRADSVLHHRLPPLRGRPQRGPDRVSDQPRPIPAHPLSPGQLRSRGQRREGIPRTDDRPGAHLVLLRTPEPDGEVRPEARQVHGLLLVVPG